MKDNSQFQRDYRSKALLSTDKQALIGHRRRNKALAENKTLKEEINKAMKRIEALEKYVFNNSNN